MISLALRRLRRPFWRVFWTFRGGLLGANGGERQRRFFVWGLPRPLSSPRLESLRTIAQRRPLRGQRRRTAIVTLFSLLFGPRTDIRRACFFRSETGLFRTGGSSVEKTGLFFTLFLFAVVGGSFFHTGAFFSLREVFFSPLWSEFSCSPSLIHSGSLPRAN